LNNYEWPLWLRAGKNVEGFKYPLKIVVSTEGDILTVVTNYPLKKGRKR